MNRVNASVKPLLGDARQIAKERFDGSIDRIIMNLPEKAVRYVDAACMALTSHGGILHYYEFNNAPKPLETAEMRLTEVVQQTHRKVKKIFQSKIVRGVAPCTWQVVVDAEIE